MPIWHCLCRSWAQNGSAICGSVTIPVTRQATDERNIHSEDHNTNFRRDGPILSA